MYPFFVYDTQGPYGFEKGSNVAEMISEVPEMKTKGPLLQGLIFSQEFLYSFIIRYRRINSTNNALVTLSEFFITHFGNNIG